MSNGSVTKRKGKNGAFSWRLAYDAGKDAAGKRLRPFVTFVGEKKDAQIELRRLISEVDKGTHVTPGKTTVSNWIETWITSMKSFVNMGTISQGTQEGYAKWLNNHVVPHLGKKALQKLTASDIEELYAQLMTKGHLGKTVKGATKVEKGLSTGTVLHIHRALSQCLKAAKAKHLIFNNPAEDVTAPKPNYTVTNTTDENGVEHVKALDTDQISMLLPEFKAGQLSALVYMGILTGMRRGEMLALRWSSVDLDQGSLQVVRAIERTSEGIRSKETKNQSSMRTIRIDDSLCEVLLTHRTEQRELAIALGVKYPKDCLVYPSALPPHRGNQKGGEVAKGDVNFNRLWNPQSASKAFTRVARKAGFVDFTLHGLRHTHATQLLINNESLQVVSKRLGHSNPVITLSTYAHVLRQGDAGAASLMGDVLRMALGKQKPETRRKT